MRDPVAGPPGMVIVGAGEAGARAAVALRECGYDGPVTLVGEEPHHPYERPPLSKTVMTAAGDPIAATILPRGAPGRAPHRASAGRTSGRHRSTRQDPAHRGWPRTAL